MSETNERSAAMRVSQGPAAWAAFADDSGETGVTSLNRKAVEEVAARMGWQVSALYSEPTLTDEEREAILLAVEHGENASSLGPLRPIWTLTLRRLRERTK
jgi:hypothetical protein